MKNAQLPRDNMNKGHRKSLKEFRSLKDEVMLPVDKGNATGDEEQLRWEHERDAWRH